MSDVFHPDLDEAYYRREGEVPLTDEVTARREATDEQTGRCWYQEFLDTC